MTTKPTDAEWKIEYAKRSLSAIAEDAKKDIRKQIEWIRGRLDEAERCVDDDDGAPSRCGIIQSAACELEMAVGRLIAMRDAKAAIRILADAAAAKPAAERLSGDSPDGRTLRTACPACGREISITKIA